MIFIVNDALDPYFDYYMIGGCASLLRSRVCILHTAAHNLVSRYEFYIQVSLQHAQ